MKKLLLLKKSYKIFKSQIKQSYCFLIPKTLALFIEAIQFGINFASIKTEKEFFTAFKNKAKNERILL
jgi:hypothetical protein